MKYFVSLFVLLVLLNISSAASPSNRISPSTTRRPPVRSKYSSRFDNIDVDAILRNSRLLKNYMNCVMDRGPCTREGLELRKRIPDALQTECEHCTDKQKEIAGKVMSFLLQYHKAFWNELLAKYDPEGTFRKKYEVEDFGDTEGNDEDYVDNE